MHTPTISTGALAAHPGYRLAGSDFSFELLDADARAEVLAHLHRLSADDRALRFSSVTSDAALDAYAARIDFARDLVVAARDAAGAIIGLAQVMPLASDRGSPAEVAFSVNPAARGRGLGRRLMAAAIEHAGAHGINRLVAQVCPRNAPMLAIFRAAGMALAREDGEMVGTLAITAAA